MEIKDLGKVLPIALRETLMEHNSLLISAERYKRLLIMCWKMETGKCQGRKKIINMSIDDLVNPDILTDLKRNLNYYLVKYVGFEVDVIKSETGTNTMEYVAGCADCVILTKR